MDRLVFFSRSGATPPGKGAHERVGQPDDYAKLWLADRNWRRVLSNFHESPSPFAYREAGSPLDGLRFRTIEHAFHALKFARHHAAEAMRFAVESNDPIALGPAAAARTWGRKLVRLSAEELAEWDATKGDAMARAAECKFAADERARRVLAFTAPAELWHLEQNRGRASTLVRFEHLETLRPRFVDE